MKMKVYQDPYYQVEVDEATGLIRFIWQENHPEVSHDLFVAACCNFIGYGFEYQSNKILIDTLNFTYTPTPEFYQWQKTIHHDRYRKLGINRVAYVLPEAYVEQLNSQHQAETGFATRYFGSEALANKWLFE